MNLRKSFIVLALCGAVLTTACDDDHNDTPEQTIALVDGKTGVTLNREEGFFEIGLAATGRWTASVNNARHTPWITLLDTEGEGNATVRYMVEPNTTDNYREGTIRLVAGNQTVVYTVTQTIVGEHDDLEGENGVEVDYSMFGSTVPLGYGMRIKGKEGMKRFNAKQIFSVKNLNRPEVADALEGSYVEVQTIPTDEIELSTGREFRDKEQDIKANLSVNIQFGMFKLGLKGAFNMTGASTDSTYNYTASTSVPSQEVTLDYEMLLEDCANIDDEEVRNLVLSKSFVQQRDTIQTLVAANADASLIEEQLQYLDEDFGPVFCAGATLGGNANVSVIMTRSSGQDTLAISGELSAAFTSLFSLDVTASADYLNTSRAYLENSDIKISVTGGTRHARTNLITEFGKLASMGAEADDINTSIINHITSWAGTIDSSNSSTFTCTEYSLIGVWELFENRASQNIVKDYFRKLYPNKDDGTSPYLVNIENMTE